MDENRAEKPRFPEADQELTPPHGDELRSEETFGRTDRYANEDDSTADKTEDAPPTITGETGTTTPGSIGRGGDTIVNDRITNGHPLDGIEREDVDRRAP